MISLSSPFETKERGKIILQNSLLDSEFCVIIALSNRRSNLLAKAVSYISLENLMLTILLRQEIFGKMTCVVR